MNETNIKKSKKISEVTSKKEKANRIILVLHLFAYAAVIALLVMVWILAIGVTGILFFWPIFPMLGWGIGVGIHALIFGINYEVTPFLAKLKTQSLFKIFFVFHAWVYVMVNLIVVFGNLMTLGTVNIIYFYWPLIMWGIALAYHGIGYLTWDKKVEKERARIMREETEITEKRAKKLAAGKVANLLILAAHITYFIVAQILIYTLFFPIDLENGIFNSILWGIALVIHIFGYFLYFYKKEIAPVKKGVIIHAALYVGFNPFNIIRGLLLPPIDTVSPFVTLLIWGIFLAFHIFIAMKYGDLQKDAETVLKEKSEELSQEELQSKIKLFVAWKWTFLGHIVMYIVGLILIAIALIVLSLDLVILIYAALGWLIGLSAHYSIYWILMIRVKRVLKWTLRMHLHVYIPTCVDMVVLNLIAGGFPWSPIAILGWGIGIGVHYILNRFLTK